MKFNITGRNINVREKTKDQITKKFSKLSKLFPADTTANVTLSTVKDDYTVEVTIPIKNQIIRAEETSADMYQSIDLAREALEHQIKKHHKKLIDRTQSAESISELFVDEEEADYYDGEIRIDKVKRFDFKPMSPEEACMQMDLLGHAFFVFNDAETGETCVVYKRKGNSYGLIEPEA